MVSPSSPDQLLFRPCGRAEDGTLFLEILHGGPLRDPDRLLATRGARDKMTAERLGAPPLPGPSSSGTGYFEPCCELQIRGSQDRIAPFHPSMNVGSKVCGPPFRSQAIRTSLPFFSGKAFIFGTDSFNTPST